MDNKTVNKAIRTHIRPLLKENGFLDFTTRTSWRYREKHIEIINFQSYSAHLAQGLGCTSFSFGINLGIYLLYIPERFPNNPLSRRHGQIAPKEHQCHFRRSLRKGISQAYQREDIWAVSSNEAALEPVIQDAKRVIASEAFDWFDYYRDDMSVLYTLKNEESSMSGTWGFGKNPSPVRSYFLGYTALECGDLVTAQNHLQNVVVSESFKNKSEDIRATLDALKP